MKSFEIEDVEHCVQAIAHFQQAQTLMSKASAMFKYIIMMMLMIVL